MKAKKRAASVRKIKREKRDLAGLEKRRREGMRLLGRGHTQAQVARMCGVSRCTALHWYRMRQKEGSTAWKRRPIGQPPKLTPEQWRELKQLMRQGALAHGFPFNVWTLRRIVELMRRRFRVSLSTGQVAQRFSKKGWRNNSKKAAHEQIYTWRKRKSKKR